MTMSDGLGAVVAGVLTCALQGQAAPRTYTYCTLGNRIVATNQIRFTTGAGFPIEPRRPVAGEKVNLFGRNFPIGQNSAVTVSFNGTPGVVQSVAERVITVVVPANVTSGPVTLRVQGGPPIPVGDLSVQGVTVSPSVVDVTFGEQRQFTAAVLGRYPGTLSITLLAGFVPSLGQAFDIATHASTSGTFRPGLRCNVGGRILVPSCNPTHLRFTVQ